MERDDRRWWFDFTYKYIKNNLSKDETSHIWFYRSLIMLQYHRIVDFPDAECNDVDLQLLKKYMSVYYEVMWKLVSEGFDFEQLLCLSFS